MASEPLRDNQHSRLNIKDRLPPTDAEYLDKPANILLSLYTSKEYWLDNTAAIRKGTPLTDTPTRLANLYVVGVCI